MNPSAEDFEAWKTDPVTRAYFASLAQERLDICEQLGSGRALSLSEGATGVRYAVEAGRATGIQEAIQHTPAWAITGGKKR